MEIQVNSSIEDIARLLSRLGWITQEQIEDISIAGEGNMNVVLRVRSDKRSFILKQSRAYVQKYPDIPAPIERIDVEAQFYDVLKDSSVSTHLPTILHYNQDHHLLMMEDLGDIEDLTSIYRSRSLSQENLALLVQIAFQTHSSEVSDQFPDNLALRQLNHQHIFHLPFLSDNGFSLDDVQPGLQDIAATYQKDEVLAARIKLLGEEYLASGTHLIHGDYYPGSWMTVDNQLYVLDPEFAHVGQREFDLGVMGAHLMIATHEEHCITQILDLYPDEVNSQKVYQYAGTEIMRRLIGLAQLPLERTLEEKTALLQIAKSWIL